MKNRTTFIVCGGGRAHIGKKIDICPTILARVYKGFDTYGIPAVIEYEWKDKNDDRQNNNRRNAE